MQGKPSAMPLKPLPNPSPDQERIIAAFSARPRRHLFVNAVAGSGKTTTIRHLLVTLSEGQRRSACYCAFSAKMKEEMSPVIRGYGANCKTIHGMGRGLLVAWLKAQDVVIPDSVDYVDNHKNETLTDYWLETHSLSPKMPHPTLKQEELELIRESLVDLVHLVMVTLTPLEPAALEALADHYSLLVPEWEIALQAVPEIIQSTLKGIVISGEDTRQYGLDTAMSGDDMIYWPNRLDLRAAFQYLFLFVDEAQDLSAAQRGIVRRCLRPGGQITFVGDKNQAVYGFAGADCDSVDRIIAEWDCVLPTLPVCYRCPKSHLRYAAAIVPAITPAEHAIEGEMWSVGDDMAAELMQPGHLVVCRTTAPLAARCWELIRLGKPAVLLGRDISKGMEVTLRRLEKVKNFDIALLPDYLATYQAAKIANLGNKPGKERKAQTIVDQCETVRVLWEKMKPQTLFDFIGEIRRIFSDKDEVNVIRLATGHRVKGLEAEVVWIERDDLMPLSFAFGWQLQQEWNLRYVAYTRALQTLFIIREKDDLTVGKVDIRHNPPVYPALTLPLPEPEPTPSPCLAPNMAPAAEFTLAHPAPLTMPDGYEEGTYRKALFLTSDTYAAQAESAQKVGKDALAAHLYRLAFDYGLRAARSLREDLDAEPLRSCLYHNAVYLALAVCDLSTASTLIEEALRSDMPAERRAPFLAWQAEFAAPDVASLEEESFDPTDWDAPLPPDEEAGEMLSLDSLSDTPPVVLPAPPALPRLRGMQFTLEI